MTAFYKFILFALILSLAAISAFYIYRALNNRIKKSSNGWELLGYSLLLIIANAAIFTAAIFLLIYLYAFLK